MGKPSFSPSSTMFLKAFHFWIVETWECLVLKLTREVPIHKPNAKPTDYPTQNDSMVPAARDKISGSKSKSNDLGNF